MFTMTHPNRLTYEFCCMSATFLAIQPHQEVVISWTLLPTMTNFLFFIIMFTLQSLPNSHGRCIFETSHKFKNINQELIFCIKENGVSIHRPSQLGDYTHWSIYIFLLSYFISDFVSSQSTATYIGNLFLIAKLCEAEFNHKLKIAAYPSVLLHQNHIKWEGTVHNINWN